MAARDAEAANMLGMNMVHEIVTGKRTVEEAREATAENTSAYAIGRSAPYAERLLFDVPPGGTEDLDESMIGAAAAKQVVGKLKDAVTGGDDEATDRRTGAGGETPQPRPAMKSRPDKAGWYGPCDGRGRVPAGTSRSANSWG